VRKKTILTPALALIASATAIVMASTFFIYQSSFARREREWFELKLDAAVRQLEAGLTLAVWNLDRQAAEHLLQSVLEDIDYVSVRLESRDGLFAPLALSKPEAPDPAFVRTGNVAYGGHEIATFALGVDDRRIRERVESLRRMFGAATVVLEAVLAGALWLILWSTVLRPLRKLEEYAASVAEVPGDAPAAAGFDEIGNVEASVRTMVGQLERRYRELEQAQAGLNKSLAEKEVLLRELHHRVKNNLSIIYSLLYFQKERFEDPALTDMFVGLQNRIQAMALLHQRLCRAEDLNAIDLSAYLAEVAQAVSDSYSRPGDDGMIELETRLEPAVLDIEIALPCGLLVNELLSNAYRHAFPAGRPGKIVLHSGGCGDRLEVYVEDDGVGLGSAEEAGLGSAIVESLAAQMHGDLVRSSEEGRGTRVSIRFPGTRRLDGAAADPSGRG
jgi:two-component sensor histidine kinase